MASSVGMERLVLRRGGLCAGKGAKLLAGKKKGNRDEGERRLGEEIDLGFPFFFYSPKWPRSPFVNIFFSLSIFLPLLLSEIFLTYIYR
jgi:hypothetical protein